MHCTASIIVTGQLVSDNWCRTIGPGQYLSRTIGHGQLVSDNWSRTIGHGQLVPGHLYRPINNSFTNLKLL